MVVDAYGVSSWEEYALADRAARGTPLNRSQRETAWQGIREMREALGSQGLTTWSSVCWDLVDVLDRSGDRPYAHVIADEGQDFGPAELSLLRGLVEPVENDVFLASDANQRIFKPYTPVARAGLAVRGRALTLRVNYRMTEQIRRKADQIIAAKVECDEPTSASESSPVAFGLSLLLQVRRPVGGHAAMLVTSSSPALGAASSSLPMSR